MRIRNRRAERQQYLFALKQMVTRETRRKYARSYLGIVWSVLNPLLHMSVMSLIFSTLFHRSIENFPIYLFTGTLIYSLFSDATSHGMSALVDNRSMLLKTKFSKQTFVIARVLTALSNFGYSFIVYVVLLFVFRIRPTWYMLLFPIPLVFMILFATGIALGLSVIYVYFADIKYLYSVFLQLLHYLCALFYPADRLSGTMRQVLDLNPVYNYILFARDVMLYGVMPEPVLWLKIIFWGTVSFCFGYWLFHHMEDSIMQKM